MGDNSTMVPSMTSQTEIIGSTIVYPNSTMVPGMHSTTISNISGAVTSMNESGTIVEDIADNETASHGANLHVKIIYIVIGSVGLIGNIMVLMVMLSRKQLRSKTTNKFIINQSFIDTSTSLILITSTIFDDVSAVPKGLSAYIFCVIWMSKFFLWSMLVTSTYNLVAMTIEKYIAILYAFKHIEIFTKRRTYIVLAMVWFVGPLWNMYLAITTTVIDDTCSVYSVWNPPESQTIFGICVVVFQWFIPIVIMVVCYGRIAWFVHTNTTLNYSDSFSEQRQKKMFQARRNVIKTLILVGLGFIVCWSSNQVFFLLFNLGVPLSFEGVFYNFTVIATFCNCAINPFLYSIQFREFQKGAAKLFCRKSVSEIYADTFDQPSKTESTTIQSSQQSLRSSSKQNIETIC